MNQQHETKVKEIKITQNILLGMVSFFLSASLLDALSISPNLSNFSFYVFLIIVTACIYKPFRLFLLKIFVSFISMILPQKVKSSLSKKANTLMQLTEDKLKQK